MSPENNESFTSSCLVFLPFISFSCVIAVARTSKTILNISGDSRHSCLVPGLLLVNLKIKKPFKVRGNKHLFEIKKRIAIREILIHAEAQIGEEAKVVSVYEKGKGNSYINRREAFLLV